LQVLEAVADAVAQLVMFSVEAEENNSILPDIVPGAQGSSLSLSQTPRRRRGLQPAHNFGDG
jgi:hypothetical protein